MAETTSQNLTGVPETYLAPLYWKAMESLRPDAMIWDENAVTLISQMSLDFSRVRQIPMSELLKAMRIIFTREMDRYARDFLSRHSDAVVVHIGCGIDSRFERVDNGQVKWLLSFVSSSQCASSTSSLERQQGEKILRRLPMTDKRTFLASLAAGAIGGLLIKRLAFQPRRMPYLAIGQQVLAETRGPVQATLLAARVQARYDELYARRLRFDKPALRQHYEEGILPSLALYQTLREECGSQEAALEELDRIIAAQVEQSGRRRLVQILGRMPDPFAVLRIANRWAMKVRYPQQGWRFEWVEDSDQCIAYDARECFYLNVLAACGSPELTAHLCAVDDLLYNDLPGISWERTKTLGRGDDRCDFRFCRSSALSASAS